jgi:tetratricopeptide (TPR) repeat protein
MRKIGMGKTRNVAGHEQAKGETPGGSQVVVRVLKWVGAATAVLSLIFGLNQLVGLVSGSRAKNRRVAELLSTGRTQQEARDYAAAWKSFEEADRMKEGNREVRAAQESLAMAWLEEGRLSRGEAKFEDLVGKVLPVLQRALPQAEGVRKADLLAHLGWAEFLRSRDGTYDVPPEDYYQQALKIDPRNPYAQAMLGHWILWNGGKVGDAEGHFSIALASGRARSLVRGYQLAGLQNQQTEEAQFELIRVANEMRKNTEPVDFRTTNRIWAIYYFHLGLGGHDAERKGLLTALPPAEQLATFSWLFDVSDFDTSKLWSREYYRAILQEAAARRPEALETFLHVRATMSREVNPAIQRDVEAAIKRLSKPS